MTQLCRQLEQEGISAAEHYPLAGCSTFRIGGAAALAVFPRSREQLLRTLVLISDRGCAYRVIGNGSNMLFPDGEYPGAVVFTGEYRELTCTENEITASAGVPLSALARLARDRSLSGAEFAAGIPGTVGGAVFMNAGAFGCSMEQITVWSDYWDAEHVACGRLTGSEQCFSTRSSIYTERPYHTVLSAGFHLQKGNIEDIRLRMADFRARRNASQPQDCPNAGSIFRHPPGHFAGQLIEECGLKGVSVGGAEVSRKHAGFIVNRGGATERDVRALIALIRERVLQETGIMLECEIRTLDNQPI